MNDLQTVREQVDQLRAEAIDAERQLVAEAYSRVLGLIDTILGKQAPAVTSDRHYTDAEIQERLDTAGSHPQVARLVMQMLRQVFHERVKSGGTV